MEGDGADHEGPDERRKAVLECDQGVVMNKANTFDSAADESADYKAAVIEYIKKVDRVQRQMAEDQKEINRLRVETREILARLEAA